MAILIEAPERYPVAITGGAGAIGSEITIDRARRGIQTFVFLTNETRRFGGTPQDRFYNRVLQPLENLRPYDGVEAIVTPIPIFEDLRDKDAVTRALDKMNEHLHPEQQIHLYSLAAAGFRTIARPMGEVVAGLNMRIKRNELLSVSDLEQATEAIKALTLSEGSLAESRGTNSLAAVYFYDCLNESGRLGEDSLTANFSSTPTYDFITGGKVNAFYLGLATGKSEGERGLEDRCVSNGQTYLRIYVPVVKKSEVATMGEGMRRIQVRVLGEEKVPEIQMVTIGQTTNALSTEAMNVITGKTDRIKIGHLGLDGLVYEKRPDGIRAPILPYF